MAMLDGTFRVVDFVHQSVGALSTEEARAFVGRSASFRPGLDTPWARCDEPSYRHRELTVDAYLEEHRVPVIDPDRAERWGLDRGAVVERTAACPSESVVVVATSTGHLLVGHDGVTFVLAPVEG